MARHAALRPVLRGRDPRRGTDRARGALSGATGCRWQNAARRQHGPRDRHHLDEQRLRRLIAVGRGLLSQLDPEAVLQQVLATACEITGARYAALGVLDADRRELDRACADARRARDARAAVTLALDIAAMEDCSHSCSRALQAFEAARALEPERAGRHIQVAAVTGGAIAPPRTMTVR